MPPSATSILCEPVQSERAWDMSQELFCLEIYKQMLGPDTGPRSQGPHFARAAQSKRTWTFQKKSFSRQFTGKMPDPQPTTSTKHQADTLTVRTPQSGHTVFFLFLRSKLVLPSHYLPLPSWKSQVGISMSWGKFVFPSHYMQ